MVSPSADTRLERMDYQHLEVLTEEELRAEPAMKWQAYGPTVLPLWVADTDFKVAAPITEALSAHFNSGRYPYPSLELVRQVRDLVAERITTGIGGFGHWEVSGSQVQLFANVSQQLQFFTEALTDPGAGVAVITPVYPRLLSAVTSQGRELHAVPLLRTGQGWALDRDLLAQTLALPSVQLLSLCSPNNPTGHVFTSEELEFMADHALRHGVRVLSDDVHSPLTQAPTQYRAIAEVGPEIAAQTVTLSGVGKTYNLAGLGAAWAVYGSAEVRGACRHLKNDIHAVPAVSGLIGTAAALQHGEPWREELLHYLRGNRDHLESRLAAEATRVQLRPVQATYLAWLDLSEVPAVAEAAQQVGFDAAQALRQDTNLVLSTGQDFHHPRSAGAKWVRLNFGTSREILDQAIDRLVGWVNN